MNEFTNNPIDITQLPKFEEVDEIINENENDENDGKNGD